MRVSFEQMGVIGLALAAFGLLAACGGGRQVDRRVETLPDGVIVRPDGGPAARVRLRLYDEDILRVTAVPHDRPEVADHSLMVIAEPRPVEHRLQREGDRLRLETARLRAEVSLADGRVRVFDAAGRERFAEQARAFGPVTADPAGADADDYALRLAFNRGSNEGVYGLGQHQNGQMNYNGEDVELAQHNLVIAVPYLVSTRGYGLLWDNNAITRFGHPEPYGPLSDSFVLYDADGRKGALTVSYRLGERTVLRTRSADLDFQYLKDQDNWPEAVRGRPERSVVWEGVIEAKHDGRQRLRMYSSGYARLYLDGEKVLDRWRQNWNPWYHNYSFAMKAGERRRLRVEWIPQDGYFRLLTRPPRPDDDRLRLASETGKAIDYYVVVGEDFDHLVGGYRRLTGKAVMLPRWAYGFWQSRQRYKTQQELLDVLETYRRLEIPIDNIVLDWFYWPEDQWGSHEFDPARFPDPKAMVERVHARNAQIMISVWPKFYPNTEHFKELDEKGYIYRRNIEQGARDWVGPGYLSSFYDPYTKEAQDIYWRQIDEHLNVLGFDAWWLDATEPDIHSNLDIEERKLRMGPTALGTGAEYFNSYALPHAEGVYRNDRAADPDRRVFILTRSGFGGIQRAAAAIWSGDVAARWDDLREQISAGVNVGLAGLPNWTFDIGGFSVESRYSEEDPAHLDEWRELNLRWFQFGAFAPLFRSHGEYPYREIFNLAPPGSAVYEALVDYTRLRYRLLPYIYSLAGDLYHRDGTMMRALVMDFAADRNVWGIADQYLFGPAFLVAPVTEYRARSRRVYLPAGADWYDFYTGRRHGGGAWIDAAAPLARMPLFVRAGSVLPTGPAIQHSGELDGATLTLTVYTGADGAFELYEDDGLSYAYEQGAFSRIPIRWDDAAGVLEIGARQGRFPGMAETRRIRLRWIDGPDPAAADFDRGVEATVVYDGRPLAVERPAGNR
ncbi:MAG: alpha-xylosidase [Gammaproteobacteria bacterium]|nr:MAG: alpha-xylosidase [Gammaproteobacteria bacterium]